MSDFVKLNRVEFHAIFHQEPVKSRISNKRIFKLLLPSGISDLMLAIEIRLFLISSQTSGHLVF